MFKFDLVTGQWYPHTEIDFRQGTVREILVRWDDSHNHDNMEPCALTSLDLSLLHHILFHFFKYFPPLYLNLHCDIHKDIIFPLKFSFIKCACSPLLLQLNVDMGQNIYYMLYFDKLYLFESIINPQESKYPHIIFLRNLQKWIFW